MIELAVSLALSGAASAEPTREDLVQCLAHLSNAPEFKELNEDEIERSEAFYRAADDSYCSDEFGQLWERAHIQARSELGLPSEGLPTPGQQEVADRQVRSLFRAAWQEAKPFRANPRPLSDDKLTKMAFAWLLDDQNSKLIQGTVFKTVSCVAKGAIDGNAELRGGEVIPSKGLAASCRYDQGRQKTANLIQTRFPKATASLVNQIAERFMRQGAFWATLGAANGK